MYNIITERNLREASIPAQYTVDMEKIKQVRYSRGVYICKMLAERKESVEEAVYHDIMKVIVNG